MVLSQQVPVLFRDRGDGLDAPQILDKQAAPYLNGSANMSSATPSSAFPPPATDTIDTSTSSTTVANGSAIKPNPSSKSSPVSAQDFGFPARSATTPLNASQISPQAPSPSKSRETSLDTSTQPRQPASSSSAAGSRSASQSTTTSPTTDNARKARPPPLQRGNTLDVPKLTTSPRPSRDSQGPRSAATEDGTFGRSIPSSPRNRRGSLTLVRRVTKSLQSDYVPPDDASAGDEENARWSESVRAAKRARKRRKEEEEEDDRVVVGTKVDQNHVNWVMAYNMLTGIRFTVSRTNAKIRDGELTQEHFEARHKFSFDVTGNALMPSAKYDFKFKDYAPEVFRELRSIFRIDPANYLVSLTSKYILSELGSPGKSGGFFYFSRDYRYIIKTIHRGEHRLLRRVLREYYEHVRANPNTLLSQFYGLHRVKIPYGRKIHFVVMNNLFPPHRDIHRIFDLKGSTIGRDFREEELEAHPRATLKDLNWLRRNLHIEFGSEKKALFMGQMERDVALLQRLKIMDYSLLVGIHDLEKGNNENLREQTLQIFQPHSGADDQHAAGAPPPPPGAAPALERSESRLESNRKAKELRLNLKSQKPVPMGSGGTDRMPDELPAGDVRGNTVFYSDDGGFQASHEDNRPGAEIYYLGIIDCLTKYNLVKRSEHFFKGLTQSKAHISAVPPERYGARFVRFIGSVTVPSERAGPARREDGVADEHPQPDRGRSTVESGSGANETTLPVVQEVGEGERAAAAGDEEKQEHRGAPPHGEGLGRDEEKVAAREDG